MFQLFIHNSCVCNPLMASSICTDAVHRPIIHNTSKKTHNRRDATSVGAASTGPLVDFVAVLVLVLFGLIYHKRRVGYIVP